MKRVLVAALVAFAALGTVVAAGGIHAPARGPRSVAADRTEEATAEVTALARNPRAPNELLALRSDIEASQLLISNNNGATWKLKSDISQYASDVAYDPQNSNTIYVLCACFLDISEGETAVLLKSTDKGTSFSRIALPLKFFTDRGRIAVHPANPKILMIACHYGPHGETGDRRIAVLRTTDGGATWRAAKLGFLAWLAQNEARDIAISRKDPNIVYMCGLTDDGSLSHSYSQVYLSRNAGGTWKNITDLDVFGNRGANGLAIHPDDPERAWVADNNGLARTADAGVHWKLQSSLLPYGFTPTAIALDALKPTTLYTGGGKTCLKSSDGGLTWKPSSKGLSGKTCLRILARGPVVHFATEAGVFRSLDGGLTWKKTL